MSHSHSRPISELSESISRLLNTYAVSAASTSEVVAPCGMHSGPCHHSSLRWSSMVGAALGAMALVQPAEAKIIYTAANVQIHDGYFPFDLNRDGLDDMGFHQRCFTDHCTLTAYGKASNGIQAVGVTSFISALALKGGSTIGPKAQFEKYSGAYMAQTVGRRFGDTYKLGYWFVSGARFLGVAFQIDGKMHYGWMRLVNSSQFGALLTGYAYETIPGKSIKAGQTKDGQDGFTGEPQDGTLEDLSPTSSVSSPAVGSSPMNSLGALALGSEGLKLWRTQPTAK